MHVVGECLMLLFWYGIASLQASSLLVWLSVSNSSFMRLHVGCELPGDCSIRLVCERAELGIEQQFAIRLSDCPNRLNIEVECEARIVYMLRLPKTISCLLESCRQLCLPLTVVTSSVLRCSLFLPCFSIRSWFSNVVEKCVTYCTRQERAVLVEEICACVDR